MNTDTALINAISSFRKTMLSQNILYPPEADAPFVAGFGAGLLAARGASDDVIADMLSQCIDYAITRSQLAGFKVGV